MRYGFYLGWAIRYLSETSIENAEHSQTKEYHAEQLAARSNVSYATLRKFEKTGQISLESFVKLTMELGVVSEINALFEQQIYSNIQEVINDRNQNS